MPTKAKPAKKKPSATKAAPPKKKAAAQSKVPARKKPAAKPPAAKSSAAKKPAAPKKAAAKGAAKLTKQAVPAKKKAAPPKAVATKKPPVKAAPPAPKKSAPAAKPAPEKAPVPKAAATKPAPAKAVAAPVKAAPAPAAPVKPASPAPPTAAKSDAAQKTDKRRALAARNKILSREFLHKLAEAIRAAVLPLVEDAKGREIVGTTASGDATFELDATAERALMQHLKLQRAPVAYYSEDAGYSTFSNAQPKNLLVVDPVDGSRAAKSGFEGCVISIATTRVIERPTMSDVDNALIMEIKSGRYFYAERGEGARIYHDKSTRKAKLSENTDLETIAWSLTVPGRPAELVFPTAARLIDTTSLKGGFFACNSTAYSLTRLLTGQQDAAVDFAGRFYKDIPDIVQDYFINAGRGHVMGIAPYDLVAALLIAQEAGCTVTNAYGQGFDDVLLLDSSSANHQTLVAASNPALHHKLLTFFDTRVRQLEELLKRRAAK